MNWVWEDSEDDHKFLSHAVGIGIWQEESFWESKWIGN